MGLGGMVGAAAATYVGAKVGAEVGKEVEPKMPPGIENEKDPYNIWRKIRLYQGCNIARALITGAYALIVWSLIEKNASGWKVPLEYSLYYIVLGFIVWLIFRSCERSNLQAAIKVFVAKGIEDQDWIQLKCSHSIPYPSKQLIEQYNQKVTKTKAVADRHLKEGYSPDFNNLDWQQCETIYDLFNDYGKERLKNYFCWMVLQPEESRNKILGQMKEIVDKKKIELFDEKMKRKR